MIISLAELAFCLLGDFRDGENDDGDDNDDVEANDDEDEDSESSAVVALADTFPGLSWQLTVVC